MRTDAQGSFIPHDLRPLSAVNQQAQPWLKVGCFETMASDLERSILRLMVGQAEQPTAAVLNGCTLQNTLGSDARAVLKATRKERAPRFTRPWTRVIHLLALRVTAVNEQDLTQAAGAGNKAPNSFQIALSFFFFHPSTT